MQIGRCAEGRDAVVGGNREVGSSTVPIDELYPSFGSLGMLGTIGFMSCPVVLSNWKEGSLSQGSIKVGFSSGSDNYCCCSMRGCRHGLKISWNSLRL